MRKRPMCLISLIFALGICLMRMTGVPLWGTPVLSDDMQNFIQSQKQVQIVGEIRNYEKKSNSAGYLLCDCTVKRAESEAVCERLYMLFEAQDLPIGSVVHILGTLKVPEAPGNPGQFDAKSYYETKGICCLVYADEVTILKKQNRNLPEVLRKLREACGRQMEVLLPEKEAGVMQAMLLGDRSALDDQVNAYYQQAGIVHVLSVSGMHLSLLGMGIFHLCGILRLGRKKSAAISGTMMILYGILTGCHTATVRAMIMFCAAMGARIIGRTYDALSALALASTLMLAEQPRLLFSGGFLMSVGAVLGVVLVCPILFPEAGTGKTVWDKVLSAIRVYAAVTAVILPLCAWFYYEIPLLGALPNLLTGPTLAAVLLPGVGACLMGFFNLQAAEVLIFPARILLKCYLAAAETISRVPGSVWICGQPEIYQVWGYYCILILLLLVLHVKQKQRREEEGKNQFDTIQRTCSMFVLFVAALFLFWRTTPEFEVTVLDVGQGDCIEVRSGEFHLLIDGGSSSVSKVGTYRILPWLRQQGISRLDGIVITHPDEDHINGILEIMNAIAEGKTALRVKYLFLPIWMKNGEAEIPLISSAQSAGIVVQYLQAGDQLQNGKLKLTVLHPEDNEYYLEHTNAGSIVLQSEYEGFQALFTGDLEGVGEDALKRTAQHCDFLKVAHHGSANSTDRELLALLEPSISVFSCEWPGKYGHPHRELLERLWESGSRVYGTPSCGAVTVWRKSGHTYLRGFLSSEEFTF
ncbi:MAG: DNA internalization-related competence protein ComEC/Rec2 [Lachnospiraceae bacterium]|nr:DNA internalization-related competence protein ComEC/Rec2 [Lachnospiraceae bacterium]